MKKIDNISNIVNALADFAKELIDCVKRLVEKLTADEDEKKES